VDFQFPGKLSFSQLDIRIIVMQTGLSSQGQALAGEGIKIWIISQESGIFFGIYSKMKKVVRYGTG
jgi:hypothetical protein